MTNHFAPYKNSVQNDIPGQVSINKISYDMLEENVEKCHYKVVKC